MGWRSYGLTCRKHLSQHALGPPLVARKNDEGGALNARLGKNLKDKKVARAWKDFRHILMGLILILAIALVVSLIFLPIS